MRWLCALIFSFALAFTHDAAATWSVVALDARTGSAVIASATCVAQRRFATFPAEGLKDIQAIVVPGRGIAAAQAGVDRTRANQSLIREELRNGTAPSGILDQLRQDPEIEKRQFGIVDAEKRSAGYSGSDNGPASLDVQGRIDDIVYSIQGNILANDKVVHEAVTAFEDAEGTLADRAMAAMEAADAAGGDRRCSCESEPILAAPCDNKTAHVAYILQVDADSEDGAPTLFIDVTDENIEPHESANPVETLRMRYETAR